MSAGSAVAPCPYGLRIRYLHPNGAILRGFNGATPAPSSPPVSAYTHGWDTVFAVRVKDVNAELTKPGVCPAQFSTSSNLCTAKGSFGPWSISVGADGGDGTIVLMRVPVTSGTLTFHDATYDLAGSRFLIAVELTYLANRTTTLPSGVRTELVFKASSADPAHPPVSINDYDHPDTLVQALMRHEMQPWFNDQLPAIQHIFASVDINVVFNQQHLQWLAPTYTSYALHTGADDTSSFLGILGLTQGRSADGLQSTLSSNSIPGTNRAGLLISPDLFFREMLLPSVAANFSGTSTSDFTITSTEAGPVLSNARELALAPVVHQGTTYHPVLENLSISVNAGEVQMTSQTRIPISPGIHGYVKQTASHVLRLASKPDGSKTLQLVDARPPQSDHWSETDPGIQILEGVLIAIGVVAELVLTVLTDGAALILGGLVIGVLTGLAAGTPELIAAILGGELSDAVPSIDSLVFGASNCIRWAGAQDFRIQSAAFAASLQLGGDPVFIA